MIPAGKLKRKMPVWIYDGLAEVTRVTPGKDDLKHLTVVSFKAHPQRGDFTTVLHRSELLPEEKPREIRKLPLKKPAAPATIESTVPIGRPRIPFKR